MSADLVASGLWLVVPGLLPSFCVLGRSAVALCMAPLLTGIVASCAGMTALVLGHPVLPWFIGLTLMGHVAAGIAWWRAGRASAERLRLADGLVLAGIAFPLFGLRRTLVDWDARSIWLFHARWFYAGGDFVGAALGNPAFLFSHSDYPPFVPATVGTYWRSSGGVNMRTGQLVIGLLTFSAVALVVLSFPRVAPRGRALLPAVIGVLVGLGAYGFAGPYGTNGYTDLLWGAATCAAATYLLIAPPAREHLIVGVVSVLVAGMVKNEGMIAALIVTSLAVLRHRRQRGVLVALGSATLLLFLWPLLARAHGATSDLLEGGRASALIRGDAAALRRVSPSLGAISDEVGVLAILAVTATLLGVIALTPSRRRLQLGSSLWTTSAAALMAVSLLAAYVISPLDLEYHLSTSIDRTTIAVRLLLLCDLSFWALCAAEELGSLRRRRIGHPQPRAAEPSAGPARHPVG